MEYPDELKISEALPLYFRKYHFADGGYHDRFFRIRIGRFFIPVPNFKARLDAVKLHDIHHILTGYTALWKGETQIGAWELASGCGRYWVGWVLNFGSFVVGLFLFPQSLYQAFMDGRRVRTNLYYGYEYGESLLHYTVGQLRHELAINAGGRPKWNDRLLFACWVIAAVLYTLAVLTGLICAATGLLSLL